MEKIFFFMDNKIIIKSSNPCSWVRNNFKYKDNNIYEIKIKNGVEKRAMKTALLNKGYKQM